MMTQSYLLFSFNFLNGDLVEDKTPYNPPLLAYF